jgi:glyoxylase I family protein
MEYCVEHLGLPAVDPVALRDWYVRVLDAKFLFSDGLTPPSIFVQLSGGVLLEIYQATDSLPRTADNKLAGWRHVALRVDSLDAARAELEDRGVNFTVSEAVAVAGGRVLYFADAEGNLIHLVERKTDLAVP